MINSLNFIPRIKGHGCQPVDWSNDVVHLKFIFLWKYIHISRITLIIVSFIFATKIRSLLYSFCIIMHLANTSPRNNAPKISKHKASFPVLLPLLVLWTSTWMWLDAEDWLLWLKLWLDVMLLPRTCTI